MNKLWVHLAVSFLVAILLVMGAVALIVRDSVEASFGAYVNTSNASRFGDGLVAELEAYYVENDTWEGVESLLPERGGGQSENSDRPDERGAQAFIADTGEVIVAATVPEWIGLSVVEIGPIRQVNLRANGRFVGTLGEQTRGTVALNAAESRFMQETRNGLMLTALVAGLAALVMGIGLAYNLTRPLQALTNSIGSWRLRDESATITVRGTDEIQRLGVAFNDLLVRLETVEVQRQRMSADIAHELRTPVTVMRGHLEAMMDGVYPLDTAHIAVAYDQALHLARLVEDLRLLTQAEAGSLPLNLSPVDLATLINAAITRFAPLTADQGIQITTQLPAEPVIVHADPHRIQQVFDNLLSNAVWHTPSGGAIRVYVAAQSTDATVSIANRSTAPLTEDQIAHLFDRFWRGEDARERDTGGSGLGLAITRQLLRLQGGDIHAKRAGDTLILAFSLPIIEPSAQLDKSR